MNVGEVNDEGLPLDTRVNTRLSRVCGLTAQQRVSLTLQGEICSISRRAEAEGAEASYEDHLSCLV
jgi:hypothetical protein